MTVLEALVRGAEYAVGVALMFLCACLAMLACAVVIVVAFVWSCVAKTAWVQKRK